MVLRKYGHLNTFDNLTMFKSSKATAVWILYWDGLVSGYFYHREWTFKINFWAEVQTNEVFKKKIRFKYLQLPSGTDTRDTSWSKAPEKLLDLKVGLCGQLFICCAPLYEWVFSQTYNKRKLNLISQSKTSKKYKLNLYLKIFHSRCRGKT